MIRWLIPKRYHWALKPRSLLHRKIGGIHWFAIGPWRISVCRTRGRTKTKLPKAIVFDLEAAIREEVILEVESDRQRLTTYTEAEHNHFIF